MKLSTKNKIINKKLASKLAVVSFIFFFCVLIPAKKELLAYSSNHTALTTNASLTAPALSTENVLIQASSDYVVYSLEISSGLVYSRDLQVTLDGNSLTKFCDTLSNSYCLFYGVAPAVSSDTYLPLAVSVTAGSNVGIFGNDFYTIDDVSSIFSLEKIQASSNQLTSTLSTPSYDTQAILAVSAGNYLSTYTGLDLIQKDNWQYGLENENLISANSYIETNFSTSDTRCQFNFVFDLDVAEDTEPDLEKYYTQGGYVVPDNINCYDNLQYCDFVFGYDINAYSRSITEEDPADQVYPNFIWSNASSTIYSATIRRHIDTGQDLYVMFDFPTPSSSSQHTLEIQDPLNPIIGSSTTFIVDVNLMSTSTSILSNCLGTCSDGFFGEIFCGIKEAVCFFITPSDNSTVYINSSFDNLKYAPPFSLVTEITDSIASGTQQEDDRSGFFHIPMITATGTYYMLPILNASSVEDVIGEENSTLFRDSMVWILYILAGLGILAFLINRSK